MYENGKIRPVEIIPGMEEERIKNNDGGEWIQLWYIIRTFVNVTMCPQHNNKIIKKKPLKT
jgi:hypothetical protein